MSSVIFQRCASRLLLLCQRRPCFGTTNCAGAFACVRINSDRLLVRGLRVRLRSVRRTAAETDSKEHFSASGDVVINEEKKDPEPQIEIPEDASPLEKAILTWSSVEDGMRHVETHGHRYTDRCIILAFEQAQVLASDAVEQKVANRKIAAPLWQFSQQVKDFLECLFMSVHRPQPITVSLLAQSLFQLGLPSVDLLLLTCLTEDRNGREVFDAEYLVKLGEVYNSRGTTSKRLWKELVRVTMEWKDLFDWPLLLRFLKAMPIDSHTEALLLPHVSKLLSQTPLSHFNHSDLVALMRFYRNVGPSARESYHLLEEELIGHIAQLSSKDAIATCDVLAKAKLYRPNLVEAVTKRFTADPRRFSAAAWLSGVELCLQGYVRPELFFQQAMKHLKKGIETFDVDHLVKLISVFSTVGDTVPKSRDFVSDHVTKQLLEHVDELTVSHLCRVMFALLKMKMPREDLVELMAERFVEVFDSALPEQDLAFFLRTFNLWLQQFSSLPKYLKKGFQIVSGQVYPEMHKLLTAVMSKEQSLSIKQCVTLLSFLCEFSLWDYLLAGRLSRHLVQHFDQLNARSLRLYFTLLKTSGYRDKKANMHAIMDAMIERIPEIPLAALHSVIFVLMRMKEQGVNVQGHLYELEKKIIANRNALIDHEWVRFVKQWGKFGYVARNIFHTAASHCRYKQNWRAPYVVELLTVMSAHGVLNSQLMMDIQETEWGQQVVQRMTANQLLDLLHSYAWLPLPAPILVKRIVERVLPMFHHGEVRRAQAITAAWDLVVLGCIHEDILKYALTSSIQEVKPLKSYCMGFLHDIDVCARKERRDLGLPVLRREIQSHVRSLVLRTARVTAKALNQEVEELGIDKQLAEFVGGRQFLLENILSNEDILINYAIQVDKNGRPVEWGNDSDSPGSRLPKFIHLFVDSITERTDNSSVSLQESAEAKREMQSSCPPVQRAAIVVLNQRDCQFASARPLGRSELHFVYLASGGWTVVCMPIHEWKHLVTDKERHNYLQKKLFFLSR